MVQIYAKSISHIWTIQEDLELWLPCTAHMFQARLTEDCKDLDLGFKFKLQVFCDFDTAHKIYNVVCYLRREKQYKLLFNQEV